MLKSFVSAKLDRYSDERNYPAHDMLSRLAPYLHYGDVSPNQIRHTIYDTSNKTGQPEENTQKFFSELVWRDFS